MPVISNTNTSNTLYSAEVLLAMASTPDRFKESLSMLQDKIAVLDEKTAEANERISLANIIDDIETTKALAEKSLADASLVLENAKDEAKSIIDNAKQEAKSIKNDIKANLEKVKEDSKNTAEALESVKSQLELADKKVLELDEAIKASNNTKEFYENKLSILKNQLANFSDIVFK